MLAISGCGERSATGIRGNTGVTGTGGVSGGVERDARLVGTWRRILLFMDETGTQHASETVWQFQPDGKAIRLVTATNLTEGFFDTVKATAEWHTEGVTVVLDFLPPDNGTVSFIFTVRGNVLALGDREFQRAP
jgi:hypothetical protein